MDEIWCLQCSTCQEHTFTVCERDVYVEPHSELHRPGLVAKLNKTMYGRQDGSNPWQKLWSEHFRSNGFELGASSPALYRSKLVNGFCHGDDFLTRRSTSGVLVRRGRSHTAQQYKTSPDSVVQKVSTTHLQREDAQDWVCKACLPTGT